MYGTGREASLKTEQKEVKVEEKKEEEEEENEIKGRGGRIDNKWDEWRTFPKREGDWGYFLNLLALQGKIKRAKDTLYPYGRILYLVSYDV